jgi:PD-(D/E)XK endonuclease
VTFRPTIFKEHPSGAAYKLRLFYFMRKKPNPKRRGEAAEAAFLARATTLGFSICVPWGESERYDCVIDTRPGFLRVQVKSATACSRSRYVVKGGGNGQPYTAEEIDFLAAYVVPKNL